MVRKTTSAGDEGRDEDVLACTNGYGACQRRIDDDNDAVHDDDGEVISILTTMTRMIKNDDGEEGLNMLVMSGVEAECFCC